ncbi:MAG: hypothetical protein E7271_11350 [Lachnospiraceae bacterium]|nr:hypothetical protein [Lachnospiraceae bacterium]
MMRKITIVLLFAIFAACIIGCSNSTGSEQTSTGVERNKIEQTQVMYNGYIYYFLATDTLDIIPDVCEKVGEIEIVYVENVPDKDFSAAGVDLTVGEEIYAYEKNTQEIYVKFDDGYKKFERKIK